MHPADWSQLEGEITHAGTAVIGFSMGAFAAVRAAASAKPALGSLHLISPAAPLQLGDFLPQMAGAPVFKAAQKSHRRLRILTGIQKGLYRVAPELLMRRMFAGSPPADRALLESEAFRNSCAAGLEAAFATDRSRYIATIGDYVQPWQHLLDGLECPVYIYQSNADTWTPPMMAQALAKRIGEPCTITTLDGLGHYSTLHAVLPKLLKEWQ